MFLRRPISRGWKYAVIVASVTVIFVLIVGVLLKHLNSSAQLETQAINGIKACVGGSSVVLQRCIAEICDPLTEDQRVTCYMRAQTEIENHNNKKRPFQ